ncbi:MAG TPA: hypothetical protein VFE62_21045 [Gemmataceae bacterium]|nr:hypothetical protein [Gemmataceae bacterium]
MATPLYVLTLTPMRSRKENIPAIIRLRKAMKALKRSYRMRVLRAERIDVQEAPKIKRRKPTEIQGLLF